MTFVLTLLAMLLLLGPIVVIHEFGHFWVARRCGVQVNVFSIGFGRPLIKWFGKDGVQYQIAMWPLGGYVSMLGHGDESAEALSNPASFRNKSPYAKMAIVAAGPLINIVLAIILFWILLLAPSEQLNTRLGKVEAPSAAQTAGLQTGDLITAIDQEPVQTWEDISFVIMDKMGQHTTAQFQIDRQGVAQNHTVDLQVLSTQPNKNPLDVMGITPWQPHVAAVIGQVVDNSPAAQYGLKAGDKILAVNHEQITDWQMFSKRVKMSAKQLLVLTVERQHQQLTLSVIPREKRDTMGVPYGELGLAAQTTVSDLTPPKAYLQRISYDPATALVKAVEKTWTQVTLTVKTIGKMIVGLIGLEQLSGPVTIAKVAKQSLDLGWQTFIYVLAAMSLGVGVMNLIPIPVLDGGQFIQYAVEAVRRKPLSIHAQVVLGQVGFLMVVALMAFVILADTVRHGFVEQAWYWLNNVFKL